jgi:hypothetical protein
MDRPLHYDGQFHILRDGRITDTFRTEKAALNRYREMLNEIGHQPAPAGPEQPAALVSLGAAWAPLFRLAAGDTPCTLRLRPRPSSKPHPPTAHS